MNEPAPARRTLQSVTWLSEAACLEAPPSEHTAILSITEPGRTAPLADGWGAVWRFQFADAEWDDAMIQRLGERGQQFDPDARGFPSARHARQILAALEDLKAKPEIAHLMVHCHRGQRRSAAVAKFIAWRYRLPFDHGYDGYNRTVLRLLIEEMRLARLRPAAARTATHSEPTGGIRGWLARVTGRSPRATREDLERPR
jgi:predicted protein tyrosine phosphatase